MAFPVNLDKHIWEGWYVRDFIEALAPSVTSIMSGNGWKRPFTTKAELKEFCKSEQPYYKKHIPDVVNYFANTYKLK